MKRMMKVWLAVLLFALLIPLCASAELPYTYTMENGEVTITGYNGTATELEIPAEIDGAPVTEIAQEAFMNQYGLTSVVLPDSLKTIGSGAF